MISSQTFTHNSLQPHGLYSPWNSPGQNTGVGSLSLLQGIFPTQGSNPSLPHYRQILHQLSHKGSLLRHQECLYRLLGPTLMVSDSEELEWSLRICVANKLPDAAGSRSTPGEPLIQIQSHVSGVSAVTLVLLPLHTLSSPFSLQQYSFPLCWEAVTFLFLCVVLVKLLIWTPLCSRDRNVNLAGLIITHWSWG